MTTYANSANNLLLSLMLAYRVIVLMASLARVLAVQGDPDNFSRNYLTVAHSSSVGYICILTFQRFIFFTFTEI